MGTTSNDNITPAARPSPALSAIARILSVIPYPLIYATGSLIGEIAYWIYPSRRRITRINLSRCFPDKQPDEITRLARGHFRTLVAGALSIPIAWFAPKARLERLVSVRNAEYLEEVTAAGKNIIILGPHFAGLELMGMYLSSQMELSSMFQKHKNPGVDRLIYERRLRFGGYLYDNKQSIRSLIKVIRSGIPFYYLPDQDPGIRKGVFAKFYGIDTSTFPALSRLAQLGQATVIPCLARLRPYGRGIELIFDAPLENYPAGNEIEDATHMNGAIESLIEYAPEQYFWSHKRFKTRPPGEPSFYN